MRLLVQVAYLAAGIWCVVDILRQKKFSTGAAVGLILLVLLLPVIGPLVYLVVRFTRSHPVD